MFTGAQMSLSSKASAALGQRLHSRVAVARPMAAPMTIEAAHKKGAGSTKNGRDSNAKRRGVKVYGDQGVTAGGIIVRQVGNKFHAGNNVGTGKDYTLYSTIEGVVKFETKRGKSIVSVYPVEEVEFGTPRGRDDGKPTRRERKAEQYPSRAQAVAA
ncbi:unnamed protein product [Pedinophyceae sp. YPF-701]|nr:unnamed protein product [Pedinophyceae sp. YPF-701]